MRGLPSRFLINAVSRFYRGFFLEARRGGRLAGFLFTAPMRWSGDPGELPGYEEVHRLLYQEAASTLAGMFDRARWRQFNTLVLLAVLVDPEERGRRLAARLVDAARRRAAEHGWSRIISPFRPVGYGSFKSANRLAHSEEVFLAYCRLRDAAGLPVDPWLRALARTGLRLLRAEMRSVRTARPRSYFEEFRRRHRPGQWYQTSEGVWECGEVATWHVEGDRVWLIEPNIWGSLPAEASG